MDTAHRYSESETLGDSFEKRKKKLICTLYFCISIVLAKFEFVRSGMEFQAWKSPWNEAGRNVGREEGGGGRRRRRNLRGKHSVTINANRSRK